MMRFARLLALLAAGAFAVPATSAFAQSDVRIDSLKSGAVELKGIDVVGSNLSREEIEAIFDSASDGDRRLALARRLKASSLAVRELVVDSAAIGHLTINDVRVEGLDEGKVRRLEVGSGQGRRGGQGFVRYRWGSLSSDQVDLINMFAGLIGGVPREVESGPMRMSWSDLEASHTTGAGPMSANGDDLVHVRLRLFEMRSQEESGVIAGLMMALHNLSLELPREAPLTKSLAEAGFETFDFTYIARISYKQATQILRVDEFAISGVGMGSLLLQGEFGKVQGVKGPDWKRTAAQEMEFIGAGMNLINKGFFEKYIAFQGKKQNKTPDQLKAEMQTSLGLLLRLVLGGASASSDVVRAVEEFIRSPGDLAVAAKAKEGPIKLKDMFAGPIASILEKVEITAVANGKR